MVKKIAFVLLAGLVIIQFFRPARNVSTAATPNDISNKYAVPANVQEILRSSCYDCHSNNTAYPWYANIQPVTWWLQDPAGAPLAPLLGELLQIFLEGVAPAHAAPR